jgi:hypothetical protein
LQQPPNRKAPKPPTKRSAPQPEAVGCGCALSGPGFVLLILTIVLTMVLASREDLRNSPLWLVLIPLILGLILLYTKVKFRKDR